MKFSIKDFFTRCDQIRSFLRIWSHLLEESLTENFIFCVVSHLESRSLDDEVPEAYSEPCQICKMALFAKTIGFQSLTIFAKSSILEV